MISKLATFCFAAATTLCPLGMQAKNYYVSNSGNDNNSGSIEQPLLTIAKATSLMKAGDECIIMGGVYYETIKSQESGTKRKPITFRNYDSKPVIIDAAEPITDWSIHSGNIYKAHHKLSARKAIYNTLFCDGDLLDIARWPNNVDGDKLTFDGHQIKGGSASHFEVDQLPLTDLSGAYFCYLGAHSGTTWSRLITSHRGDRIDFEGVDIKRWPYTPHNPTVFRNNNRGQLYLFGAIELLDHEGEWFYDAATETIYAIFPEGVDPNKSSIKAGVRPTTVEIDHDYININGLECFGGELILNGNNCRVENSKMINCSQTYEGLIGISAQSETATLMIRGGDITIENNLIEGGMASGVVISPQKGRENCMVRNNVIRNFNSIGIHANAIRSRGDYVSIINNSIYTCGRDGIYTAGRYNEIAYNDLYDCMRVNNDGGVFYTVGNDELKHTEIHHNYFHDSYGPAYADGRAAGVYLDNNSKGYDVHHNVIWNVTWSALMFNWYNTDFNFYNNTIWDCGFNTGRWANGYTIERISVVNNFANISSRDKIEGTGDKQEWIGTDFATNIIDTESPFVDVEQLNFAPAASSALIDKGTIIKGFSKGYKGSAPEIGAYELGEEPWSVGASWAEEVAPKKNLTQKRRNTAGIESEDKIFEK